MSARGVDLRGAILAVVGLGLLAVGIIATGTPKEIGVTLIVIGAGLFTVGVTLPLLRGFKVSASGFEATLRERDAAFEASVRPRQDELLHLAAWLSADPEAAPRLLEAALAHAYARPRGGEPADDVVRRLVEVGESHRPLADGEPPTSSTAPPEDVGEARSFLHGLRELPPRRRSAVVLDLLGGVASDEAARILGRTREKLEEDAAEGLAQLPGLLAGALR
jgi:DNA-directed RNA polymerase specialized sigma24 family protein